MILIVKVAELLEKNYQAKGMLKYRERNKNIDIETNTPSRTRLNVAPSLFAITFPLPYLEHSCATF